MPFESLSEKIQYSLRKLTGRGKVNEKDIEDAIAAARENLSDKWEISYNRLVVDSKGDYYVNMGLINTDEKSDETQDDPFDETATLEKFVQLYVNIQ